MEAAGGGGEGALRRLDTVVEEEMRLRVSSVLRRALWRCGCCGLFIFVFGVGFFVRFIVGIVMTLLLLDLLRIF